MAFNQRYRSSSTLVVVLAMIALTVGWRLPAAAEPAQVTTVESRVVGSGDDAEERASGSMKLTSSDLELVFDRSDQTIGLRFTNLNIPTGASITNAYVQFQADESQSVATTLQIRGETTSNPSPFVAVDSNITNRPTTGTAVDWGDNTPNPLPAWTKGDAGSDQRSPDLSPVIQEIIDLQATTTDTIVLIITGTGHRTAESFDGQPTAAPLLHIEYQTSNEPPSQVGLEPVYLTAELPVNAQSGVKIADIVVTDDGMGSNQLALVGGADTFEIVGSELYLTSLTAAVGATLSVTIDVDDPDVGTNPDASTTEVFTVVGTDNPPSGLSLENASNVPEDQDTSSNVKVGDIVLVDDGVGVNELTLGGADASSFLAIGTELFLAAGAELDYETKPTYEIDLLADGKLVGAEVDVVTPVVIFVEDVFEPVPTILEYRVSASSDDAEERITGVVKFTSKDLELVDDPTSDSQQTVGIRFAGVAIPASAQITKAYIQFEASGIDTGVTTLQLRGEAADNPATFTTTDFDVTSRPTTTGTVNWDPPGWMTIGENGLSQRTPDVAQILQEIVDRPGWGSGNAVAFFVTGVGERTAVSYDGDVVNGTNGAPLLHVEFVPPPPDPGAVVITGDADVSPDEVVENSPTNTPVGITVTADDPDDDPAAGDGVTFSVQDPTSSSSPRFAVDPVSGVITVAANIDFEDLGSTNPIPLTVTATSTSDGTTATGSFHVLVLDINEPAAFNTASSSPVGPDADLMPDIVADNASPGASVGITASAADPDAQDTISYSLIDVAQPAIPRFTVDPSSGIVTRSATGDLDHALEPLVEVEVTATSTDGTSAAHVFAISVVDGQKTATTVESRVGGSLDDAEEKASGSMKLTSSDLELVFDRSDQTIGLRFTNLNIPTGATITNAYIQFEADESQSVATTLQIRGETTTNPSPFAAVDFNITNRPTTGAAVDWGDNTPNPLPAWTKRDAGVDQRSPDLSPVIQEIIDLQATTDTIVLIITGTGHRTAESFDGKPTAAPLLHIDYLS